MKFSINHFQNAIPTNLTASATASISMAIPEHCNHQILMHMRMRMHSRLSTAVMKLTISTRLGMPSYSYRVTVQEMVEYMVRTSNRSSLQCTNWPEVSCMLHLQTSCKAALPPYPALALLTCLYTSLSHVVPWLRLHNLPDRQGHPQRQQLQPSLTPLVLCTVLFHIHSICTKKTYQGSIARQQ